MLESIKVVSLSKQFGSVSALNEVSIEFKKNKIYAILGHNGAGKTPYPIKIILFLWDKVYSFLLLIICASCKITL